MDPLRAPVVAILDGRFAYFCSTECKQAASAQSIAPPPVRPAPPPAEAPPPPPTEEYAFEEEPEREDEGEEAPPESIVEPPAISSAVPRTSDDRNGRAVRALALVLGASSVAIALVDARANVLRLLLATAACILLLLLVLLSSRRARGSLDAAIESDLGGPLIPAAVAASATVALAWILLVLAKPGAATATATSVWVVLAAAAAEVVAFAVLRGTLADARALVVLLDGQRETSQVGDVLALSSGDRLYVDARVISGEVICDQWGLDALRARRKEGDPIPAGAVVREGSARARVTAIGRQRAFSRLLTDAIERSDRASPGLRALDRSAPWIVALVFVVSIALGFLSRGRIGPTLAAAVAAGAAILIPPARRLAVREQLRGLLEACRRGAAFRDADAFVRAGSVRTAIFCARGTLHAMVPDACDVEEISGVATAGDILALAAGAERSVEHAIAQTIVRTAAARNIRPIEVRNVHYEPGLGVRSELPGGQPLVVGGRELLLRAHVPTAEHEARIAELEEGGREVVLVARAGRVIGVIAMQYPLRAGALAAVQRVEDVEVEPVLLGGGARPRLEALGNAVGITHVRPEVLPDDRGAEVRRIAQSGGPVAVIGRVAMDASALAAADVAIALDEAGTAPDARDEGRVPAIALVHDRLVPAVDVLALAQATRARVAATLLVGLSPVALAALPVAFGLVRPAWAPLAAVAATLGLAVRELVAAALPEGGHFDDTR